MAGAELVELDGELDDDADELDDEESPPDVDGDDFSDDFSALEELPVVDLPEDSRLSVR